jgi:hypothetical protein
MTSSRTLPANGRGGLTIKRLISEVLIDVSRGRCRPEVEGWWRDDTHRFSSSWNARAMAIPICTRLRRSGPPTWTIGAASVIASCASALAASVTSTGVRNSLSKSVAGLPARRLATTNSLGLRVRSRVWPSVSAMRATVARGAVEDLVRREIDKARGVGSGPRGDRGGGVDVDGDGELGFALAVHQVAHRGAVDDDARGESIERGGDRSWMRKVELAARRREDGRGRDIQRCERAGNEPAYEARCAGDEEGHGEKLKTGLE